MSQGYYRFPTIFKETIVFVSEDDLWSVPLAGGVARRLTSGRGISSRPKFSPDGRWIAFSASEEGATEVFIMPSSGGEIRRLTYLGENAVVTGWTPNGEILFASAATNAERRPTAFLVHPESGQVVCLNLGPATSVAFNAKGGVVVERGAGRSDPAHWKRYRGGTAGQLWTASSLDGEFTRILRDLKGNLTAPYWVKDRIYFIADHEGWGNVYSCRSDGSDLKTHTKHRDYYARNIHTDGQRLVYHAGGDLFVLDLKANRTKRAAVQFHSQRTQRQRKLVSATENFESCHLSPDGSRTAYTTRGQVFNFANWQGPVYRNGLEAAVRFRLGRWLKDGERIAAVSDSDGKDKIEVFQANQADPINVITKDFGRITEMKVAPTKDLLAIANHRNELFVLDLQKETLKLVARNEYAHLHAQGFSWSPDSRFLAFCQNLNRTANQIQIFEVESGKTRPATRAGLLFSQPVFDPKGEYLYFLSNEKLNPVYSDLLFDISFPRTSVPGCIALRKETTSPFVYRAMKAENKAEEKADKKKAEKVAPVVIDWNGLEKRMQYFPVIEAKYRKILATKEKVFLVSDPVKGSARENFLSREGAVESRVQVFNFKTNTLEEFLPAISDFQLNDTGTHFLTTIGSQLRVGKAQEKTWKKDDRREFSEDSGWINLSRIQVMVDPVLEWQQMFGEVWRLQRDFFWVEDMSGVDWVKAYKQYRPLIDRIGCRTEFSDLVWEMQGELGTSHAYDIGGDVKAPPAISIGKLGADLEYVLKSKSYRITKIYDGEVNEFREMSPLGQPGLNVQVGDEILAIDGIEVGEKQSPSQLLVARARQEVELTIRHRGGERKNHIVYALSDDKNLRYRQWVEDNRKYVHDKTKGKVGYVHIPDMSADGYAEFFRTYMREYDRDGLIIDVRFNGGGHVSQLILEYLSRQRLGVDQTRWLGVEPYPAYSPKGPMVALTNQHAGSDGDIFSHAFKMMKLGPLIGTRTWGGVIGIHPRNFLADGGITTQPEFSFWFSDVGWGVENYGTDPDIEVDIAPHDYRRGRDPQLDRGIAEVLKIMAEKPPFEPDLRDYPNLGI